MFQIHYQPNGQAARDKPKLGIKFANAPPQYEVNTGAVADIRFEIPARHPSYKAQASITFSEDTRLVSFMPHMHIRGKSFSYRLNYPDGSNKIVLTVPRYDSNWQQQYVLQTPIDVPAGTKLTAIGWFDNGIANPLNPDPEKVVRFGPQWDDEMLIGYFDWHRL